MTLSNTSSLRWTQLNSLCDQFEDAWQSGAGPRAEDYLVDVPAEWLGEARRELIKLDLFYRRKAGLPDEAADYATRFPDIDPNWLQQLLAATSSRGSQSARQASGEIGASRESRLRPVLPGYEILEIIGRGGMGVVYKARQIELDRIVAIKMILAGEYASPETTARFRSEARAVAQLQHPNLVQIYEVGEFNGRPFLTFEYVDGGSLDRKLRGVPQLPKPSARMIKELALATQFAHNRSIVHRDLKPANILLADTSTATTTPEIPVSAQTSAGSATGFWPPVRSQSRTSRDSIVEFGQPKIADFGLAKDLEEDGAQTLTGVILGSPSYMAPEQASGQTDSVGPPADTYALGAILYEMLTGRPPFRAPTVSETIDQVRSHEPIALRRLQPSIPRDLETICLKCLQKEPSRRYPSAGALAEDLDRYLRDEPVQARPVSTTERAYRWCRRYPQIASLLMLLVLVTIGGAAGIAWQWKEATHQRDIADTNAARYRTERDAAQRQRVIADDNRQRSERSAYFHRIGQAYGEWEANQVGRAVKRLADCPQELRGWEWQYLHGLCHSEKVRLAGHTDEVCSVEFSGDGKTIISGSGVFGWKRPGEIVIWDAATGRQKHVLKGHHGPILDIACNANASRIVTCSINFEDSAAGLIKIWSGSGEELHTLPEPGLGAFTVALSPDGKVLATGGVAPKIYLWDVDTGILIRNLSGHTSNIFGMQFSPDGKTLASVGNDGTVRRWNVDAGTAAAEPLTGFGNLRKVAFSPDGRYLAFTAHSNDLYVADLSATEEPPEHYLCACGIISSISYSPEGRRLAVSSFDGNVLLLDPTIGRILRRLHSHDGAVNAVAFGDEGRRLVTAGMDRLVKVWEGWTDGDTHEINLARASNRGNFWQMGVSTDGQKLLLPNGHNRFAANAGTNDLLVWDLKQSRVIQTLKGHTQWLTGVATSRQGDWYVTSSADKTARIWDSAAGQSAHELRGHTDVVTSVDISADSKLVATGSRDGTARLWNRETGVMVHELKGSHGGLNRVSIHPAGQTVAAATQDGTLLVWNTESGSLLKTLIGHQGPATAVTFSHNGKFLASAGDDQAARVWNGTTYEPLHTLRGHTAAVSDLAFSPDDRRLASAAADHTVKLWDPQFGDEAFTLNCSDKLMALAFAPDGQRIYASHHAIVRSFDATQTSTEAGNQEAFRRANIRWHRQQATTCSQLGLRDPAWFHCERWALLEPDSVEMNAIRNRLISQPLTEAASDLLPGLFKEKTDTPTPQKNTSN